MTTTTKNIVTLRVDYHAPVVGDLAGARIEGGERYPREKRELDAARTKLARKFELVERGSLSDRLRGDGDKLRAALEAESWVSCYSGEEVGEDRINA